MKLIPLTQGKFAKVDDEDFEYLNQWKWNYSGSYATRSSGVFMHRELLQPPVGFEVDHINRNKLDNQKSNLRLATRKQNAANRTGKKNNSSKYKGVSWWKAGKLWIVIVCNKQIGLFTNEELAARAYDRAAIRAYGDFAATNFEYGQEEINRITFTPPYYPTPEEIAQKMNELLKSDNETPLNMLKFAAIETLIF